MLLGGMNKTKPAARVRPTDPADVIAAFTDGAGTALADAIRHGEGPHVEPYPQRPLPPPTPRDEAVGTLMSGFLALKRGGKR